MMSSLKPTQEQPKLQDDSTQTLMNRRSFLSRSASFFIISSIYNVPVFSQESLQESLRDKASKNKKKFLATMINEGQFEKKGVIFHSDDLKSEHIHSTDFETHSFECYPEKNPALIIAVPKYGENIAVFTGDVSMPPKMIAAQTKEHLFYGHGCFSTDGKYFFSVEVPKSVAKRNDAEDGYDGIIVKRTTSNFAIEAIFSSGGASPHEIIYNKDGQIVIANSGGIANSNIAFLDPTDGRLIKKIEFKDEMCTPRHILHLGAENYLVSTMLRYNSNIENGYCSAYILRGDTLVKIDSDKEIQSRSISQLLNATHLTDRNQVVVCSIGSDGVIYTIDLSRDEIVDRALHRGLKNVLLNSSTGKLVSNVEQGNGLQEISLSPLSLGKIIAREEGRFSGAHLKYIEFDGNTI